MSRRMPPRQTSASRSTSFSPLSPDLLTQSSLGGLGNSNPQSSTTTISPTEKSQASTVERPALQQYRSEARRARKRVERACIRCRFRKVRCDGSKPCIRCVESDDICEYLKHAKKSNKEYSQEYVQHILEQNEKYKTAMRMLYTESHDKKSNDSRSSRQNSRDVPSISEILQSLGLLNEGGTIDPGHETDSDIEDSKPGGSFLSNPAPPPSSAGNFAMPQFASPRMEGVEETSNENNFDNFNYFPGIHGNAYEMTPGRGFSGPSSTHQGNEGSSSQHDIYNYQQYFDNTESFQGSSDALTESKTRSATDLSMGHQPAPDYFSHQPDSKSEVQTSYSMPNPSTGGNAEDAWNELKSDFWPR